MNLPAPGLRDANHLGTNVSVSRQLFKRLVPALLDDAARIVAAVGTDELGEVPQLDCPHGCEKRWDPWMWLFIASCLVSAVLATMLISMTCVLDKRERKLIAAEAEDYGENAKAIALHDGKGVRTGSHTESRGSRKSIHTAS